MVIAFTISERFSSESVKAIRGVNRDIKIGKNYMCKARFFKIKNTKKYLATKNRTPPGESSAHVAMDPFDILRHRA